MDTKGEKVLFMPPPEYDGKASGSRWKSFLLGGYACVVTVTLILVLIAGSVFILANRETTTDQTKLMVLSPAGDAVEEDEIHHTDTFFTSGSNGSIAVVDYQKGSVGVYMTEVGMCMLATGLKIQKPSRKQQSSTGKEYHLTLVTDDRDMTSELLPVKMTSLCAGKRIVHMRTASSADAAMPNRNVQQSEGARMKRGCQRRCSCEMVCDPSGCRPQCRCSLDCSW